MKRLILVLAALSLLAFPTAALARRVATCSVTPASAAAGTTFSLSASGFQANETDIYVLWEVYAPDGSTSTYISYEVTADSSGSFTTTQQITTPGSANAVVHSDYTFRPYSSGLCYFTVT
jgi:hypothetical protein